MEEWTLREQVHGGVWSNDHLFPLSRALEITHNPSTFQDSHDLTPVSFPNHENAFSRSNNKHSVIDSLVFSFQNADSLSTIHLALFCPIQDSNGLWTDVFPNHVHSHDVSNAM